MILLVDNYDSFAYNLYQLVGEALANIKGLNLKNPNDLGEITNEIKVIRNDDFSLEEIKELNPDTIILSPGPGKPSDAGICEEIITEFTGLVPILGVCLGHQAICEALGGEITYAKKLMHGKTSDIHLSNIPLFEGIEDPITVARYHSLALNENTLPNTLEITAKTEDGEIMAVGHVGCNVYGLQFHPESVLTPDGFEIVKNFLKISYF